MKKITKVFLVGLLLIGLLACQMERNDGVDTVLEGDFVLEDITSRGIIEERGAHPYWEEMNPIESGMDYYTLNDVNVTLYKTFHTGFDKLDPENPDDAIILDEDDLDDIVYLRDKNGNILKYPDNNSSIRVKKWVFWKSHLEGSAFIINPSTNKRFILNLEKPDPEIAEDAQPVEADPTRAGFKIVDYVDWGFDALPAHSGGLVPWRTVAINLSHYRIPANSWIYLPSMDGKWVPLPRLHDLGNSSGMHIPIDQKYGSDPHFDWVQHDGYFRATDISWSLPTWMGEGAVIRGKWIDMYVGTQGIMQWIWDKWDQDFFDYKEKINGHTIDRATVRVYPTVSVPAMLEDGRTPRYKYTETTSSEPYLKTKYYKFPVLESNSSNKYALFEFGDNDAEDDNDEMLTIFDNNFRYSYDSTKWSSWEKSRWTYNDVEFANYDGGNKEEIVLLRANGNETRLYYGSDRYNLKYQTIFNSSSSYVGHEITSGDYDGDGDDDIALFVDFPYGPGYAIYIYEYYNNKWNKTESTQSGYHCNVFTSGDLNGDGKDEVISAIGYKSPKMFYWNPLTNTMSTLCYGTVKSAVVMKLDSDHKDDFLVSFTDKKGIYRYLSTYNKGSDNLFIMDSERTPRYMTEYNFSAYHK